MKAFPVLFITLASAATVHAATVTWGGAGSQASPAFWNQPVTGNPGENDDPTHWNQADPPDMTGADDAVINGGGIQKNGSIDFSGGSVMTLNSGAYFSLNNSTNNFTITGGSGLSIQNGTFDATVNAITVSGAGSYIEVVTGSLFFTSTSSSAVGLNSGGQAIVRTGGTISTSTFFNSQNTNATNVGGIFVLDGGTLVATGAESNPIRAAYGLDGGGFDFTSIGGTIQLDDFTGGSVTTYLEGKATSGFFKIDGTTVSGFGSGNAVNGEWLEVTDNGGSGSLTLVPEASSALLGALGMLRLMRRRRTGS